MPDWPSLSGWIMTDVGIGAVGGSIVTGAVALLVDQRRRLDEGKNRFSEEKLRAYERMIALFDIMGEFQLLRAKTGPLVLKIQNGEDLDAADVEAQASLLEQLDVMLERYNRYTGEDSRTKDLIITSSRTVEATYRLMKVITRIETHIDAGRYEKASKLALRYEVATAGLLLAARSDLGIRN